MMPAVTYMLYARALKMSLARFRYIVEHLEEDGCWYRILRPPYTTRREAEELMMLCRSIPCVCVVTMCRSLPCAMTYRVRRIICFRH